MIKQIVLEELLLPGKHIINFSPGINNILDYNKGGKVLLLLKTLFKLRHYYNESIEPIIEIESYNPQAELGSFSITLDNQELEKDLIYSILASIPGKTILSESISADRKIVTYVDPDITSYINDSTGEEVVFQANFISDREIHPRLINGILNKYSTGLNQSLDNLIVIPNPSKLDYLYWIQTYYNDYFSRSLENPNSYIHEVWNKYLPGLDLNIKKVLGFRIITDGDFEISFNEIGSGAQYIMYILPMLVYSLKKENTVLVIEQSPSGILHPILEKFILEFWNNNCKSQQLILTTTIGDIFPELKENLIHDIA